MNDRSVELYKQALEFAYSSIEREYWDGTAFQGVVAGRFTELLVKECIDILMRPSYQMTHPEELSRYNEGWVRGRLLGIDHIKEHFGIEE